MNSVVKNEHCVVMQIPQLRWLHWRISMVCLWVLLIAISYFYVDKPLAYYLQPCLQFQNLHVIAEWITQIGSGSYNLMAALLLWLIGRFIVPSAQLRAFALLLVIVIIGTGVACDILKITLGRARPVLLLNHHHMFGFYFMEYTARMWSFPSGHTTTISASMTLMSLRWPRYEALGILVVVMVAASRLLLEQHYLSDVLSGVLLGSMLAILLYKQLYQRSGFWHQYLFPV